MQTNSSQSQTSLGGNIGVSKTPATLRVDSSSVTYSQYCIHSRYDYHNTNVVFDNNGIPRAYPTLTHYEFKTSSRLPKLGVMLIGWGGNNGSTFTASILANKLGLHWETKRGLQKPNYFGSLLLSSTVNLGLDKTSLRQVYVPFNQLLPMTHPEEWVIGGWDINSASIAEAMRRAQVLEPDLQRQLWNHLETMKPLPSIYYPEFIAKNQDQRADNVLLGSKCDHLKQLREDIRRFKCENDLDKVILLWTANTERFSEVLEGINDTGANLLKAINNNEAELSPSSMFAVASILEGCPFINGSPQNTFVPGVLDLAEQHQVFVGGDDFKSGQTKLKSVMVDFLVSAGIKPISIASYNHLGNNDGLNLSSPMQFRSKEISKKNVVDDMVESNNILFGKEESPDHVIVIKYLPAVGDSKRAMDEYENEIFMNGRQSISVYNICEDSLLAAPLMMDLVLLCELMTRVTFKTDEMENFQSFSPILSLLGYMLKAPLAKANTPIVNSLARQRACIENVLRALIGLQPQNDMLLEAKTF